MKFKAWKNRTTLVALTMLMSAAQTGWSQEEFKSIFNGQDLQGWKGNPDLWSVEDGAITGRTTAEAPLKFNTFLIWDGGKVADFELELDYKISGGSANSGIQYRSRIIKEADFIVGGYQADIDATLKYAGINYEEKGRGILVQRGERVTIDQDGNKQAERFAESSELGKHIKEGQWNHYRVVAKGPRLRHYINDQLMSEVTDEQKDKSASEGVLALQIHQGPPMVIQYKNVKIKVIQ